MNEDDEYYYLKPIEPKNKPMNKIFYNYLYTGAASAFFLLLAFIDVLIREPKNNPDNWAHTWDYMSLFGKVDAILCVVLILWTMGCIVVRSKFN